MRIELTAYSEQSINTSWGKCMFTVVRMQNRVYCCIIIVLIPMWTTVNLCVPHPVLMIITYLTNVHLTNKCPLGVRNSWGTKDTAKLNM